MVILVGNTTFGPILKKKSSQVASSFIYLLFIEFFADVNEVGNSQSYKRTGIRKGPTDRDNRVTTVATDSSSTLFCSLDELGYCRKFTSINKTVKDFSIH
ncbi:hypothetical protein AAHE18_12G145800 [Arachis hypogaea]